MKSTAKRRISLIAGFLSVLLLFTGICCLRNTTATAYEQSINEGRTYYYKELKNSALAQKFYNVMHDMAQNGNFKSGAYEYDLAASDVLSQSEIADYVENGSPKIPVAFGAARDAFYMDNPDLFYIDVYKLYLSAGMKGGQYFASIGAGEAENYYSDAAFSDPSKIENAITMYEIKLNEAISAAQAESSDPVRQIGVINKYLTENTVYDYGTYENAVNGEIISDNSVNTSYGAFVKGKALCGGYSRAFKAAMDRLNIPCVLIQGTAYSGKTVQEYEAGYDAHMWNAVQIDGLWYGVDVTWNDTAGNLTKYLLVGDDFLSDSHFPDGIISSSGFELDYPSLRPLNYGVDQDSAGFVFKDSDKIDETQFGYIMGGDEISYLVLGVSYEGKDAEQLQRDGKYLAYRFNVKEGEWSPWIGILAWESINGGFGFKHGHTITSVTPNTYQLQYAVLDYPPDDNGGSSLYYLYNKETVLQGHIISLSAIYTNDAYGTYIPAPYVKHKTPNETGYIKSFDPVDIVLEYSDELIPTEGKTEADVGLSVTSAHDDIEKYIQVENLKWEPEKNTLSFRFTPSKQYIHNCETYQFVPTNLVGKKSGKIPEPTGLSFKRKQVICSKVYNDGRLYMQVFGQPQFVGAEDMSLSDFKDKNGQPIVGNQRSQMMLVVNTPDQSESEKMEQALLADQTIGLKKENIKASSTYQIDLQICGLVQQVPKGSYMQVGFGFPDGYGPEDKGVTFTVYHYTRKADGTIDTVEEVPCVITEYGIIATVKSFSPFMICAVEAKAAAGKNIYASVQGAGGKLNETVIKTVKSGENVTYVITPDRGYKTNRILLNGTDIASKLAADGTLTLGYSELESNNVLEISFISDRAAAYRAEQEITVVQPKIVVRTSDLIQTVSPEKPEPDLPDSSSGSSSEGSSTPEKKNPLVIVGIIAAGVVAAIGVTAAFYFVSHKKKNNK